MRKLLLLFLFAGSFGALFSQCNCITRVVGEHTIKQCPPGPVSSDNKYQIALSIQEVNGEQFVLMTIRFRYSSNTVVSNLQVFSNQENVLVLELTKSGTDYVNQSEICHAQFKLSKKDVELLKKAQLTSVRFKFSGEEMFRTVSMQKNKNILGLHLKCL